MRGWSLLDYPAEISEADFRLTETGVQWEIDLKRGGENHGKSRRQGRTI